MSKLKVRGFGGEGDILWGGGKVRDGVGLVVHKI